MKIDGGKKRSTGRKPDQVPLLLPKILHALIWVQTRAVAVGIVRWKCIMNCEWCGWKWLWPNFRYNPGIWLNRLKTVVGVLADVSTGTTTSIQVISALFESTCSAQEFKICIWAWRRSQLPRDLRQGISSFAPTLGSWVQILLKSWMSLCVYSVFVFCV
jgi:hypothetical protein